jgi:hypothetical protein
MTGKNRVQFATLCLSWLFLASRGTAQDTALPPQLRSPDQILESGKVLSDESEERKPTQKKTPGPRGEGVPGV